MMNKDIEQQKARLFAHQFESSSSDKYLHEL